MRRQSSAFMYPQESQYLILGFLFLVFIFSWCLLGHCAEAPEVKATTEATAKEQPKAKPKPKLDASSFIEIKNKSPEQMFADANYLYQLGEYESALILYNKVAQETKDKDLRRRANMAREIIDILTKAERIGGPKGEKESKRADKIKERQKKDQVAYLYKEAYSRFFGQNFEQASEIFKAILAIDPGEKEAKYYFQDRIPQLVKEQKVKSLYKEGLEYFEIGDYGKAVKLFNEVLAIFPDQKAIRDDAEAKIAFIVKKEKIDNLFQQAATAFNGANYDQAANYCREILAIDQDQFKAKEYLEVSIPQKLKEQRIAVLYKDALTAFNNQELDKAKQIFYDILSLDLKQAEAKEYVEIKIPGLIRDQKVKGLLDDGSAAFNNQQYDAAEEIFNRALVLDPAQAEAIQYIQAKIPEVRKQLKIKDIYKDAVEFFSVGDYPKAEVLFKDILALDNSQEEAKEYLQVKIPEKLKLVKINVLYSQALGDFSNRDFVYADAKFREILALSPGELEAQEFVQTKIPQALREENIKALYGQALAAFDIQDYQSSIECFDQILSMDSKQQQARLYLEEKIPNQLKLVREDESQARLAQQEEMRWQEESNRQQLEQEQLTRQEKFRQQAAKQQKQQEVVKNKVVKQQRQQQLQQQEVARLQLAKQEEQMEKQREQAKQKEAALMARSEKPSQPAPYTKEQPGAIKKISVQKPKPVRQEPKSVSAKKRAPEYTQDGVVGYLYQRAFAAYSEGDYMSAQDYFTKILILAPKETVARDYLVKITNG
ncbi:MAG: tetratricopeptide repeat protein [Candidatus Omnitrophica bacterium]|nr:tetratricopeptide repeat protein [Candidatus Omnitrophota bacterium]